MIQSVGGGGAAALQQLQQTRQAEPAANPTATLASEGGGALPEPVSAFEIAQQIQEVQVDNLKRTLDAQTLVLDLLV